jgi:uncharacterized protein YdcH (DUF465 family)
MRATRDELVEHFPGKADRIRTLLTEDLNFRRLCVSYQELLEATRRCATDAVRTDSRKAEELRYTRLTLAEAIARNLD